VTQGSWIKEPRQSGERKATSAPHSGKRDLGLPKNREHVHVFSRVLSLEPVPLSPLEPVPLFLLCSFVPELILIVDLLGIRTIPSNNPLQLEVAAACPYGAAACPLTDGIPSKLTCRAGSSEIVLWWNGIEC